MKLWRLFFFAALCQATGLRASEPALDAFFESFTLEWLQGDPCRATELQAFEGVVQDALDRQMTPVTDAYADRRMVLVRRGLAELRRFDAANLSPRDRLYARMLEWQLENLLRDEANRDYRFPFDPFIGFQRGLPDFLTKVHPLRTGRDVDNYLARLGQLGPCIDAACEDARARVAKGLIPPRFILTATIAQMERFLEPPPRENVLVSTFTKRLAELPGMTDEVSVVYRDAAEKIVKESVLPAYRRALSFLQSLLPVAGDAAGLGRFAGGMAAYAQCLRSHTSTELTPEQIHQIGLREVARLEAELDLLLRELGLSAGAVADRLEQLDQKDFYPDVPDVRDHVLADYETWVRDAERRSESLFGACPQAPVQVRRESEFSEANASANYRPPAKDGSLPGIFRVPLVGPRFPRRANMRSLTYHETVPGHHTQIARQLEQQDLPRFVREDVFGGGTTAFIEGWALYAENLALEAGWYEGDIRGRIGCLEMQLFRAKRLVVDTGLHAMGWSRQQAIDYGFSASEVERYVVWPGQACAYMLGELKILELRAKARRALGPRFSLKDFHEVLLCAGAVPLPLLEQIVDDYVRYARVRNPPP